MIAMLAAAALSAAPTDADRQLVDLRRMYAQSCEVRAYATFDDICGELKKQLKAAQRDAKKVGRSRTTEAAAAPSSPSPVSPPVPVAAFAN